MKDAEKAIHDLLKTLESENRDIRKALLVAHGSMDPKKIAKALAFVSKSSTFAQDYARNLEAVRVAVAKALEQLNNPVGIPTKELTALRSQLKRELSRVTKIEQAARQVWPTISPVS